jgi:hypothetical protein
MDEKIIQDILTEVFSALEPLDAQTAAIFPFLKAKGLATDEEFAPFLEQAENASNVRWLAARVRIASLLSSAFKPTEPKPAETKPAEAKPAAQPPAESHGTANQPAAEQPQQIAQKNQTEPVPQSARASADDAKPSPAPAEKQQENTPVKSGQQPRAEKEGANEAKKESTDKAGKDKAA